MAGVSGVLRSAVRRLSRKGSAGVDAEVVKAIVSSGFFDEKWYLFQNPDVAKARIDALQHYLREGHAEGRQPGPCFDMAFYLERNPDVKAAQMEPLSHFCALGWSESRLPAPGFDIVGYQQARGKGPVSIAEVIRLSKTGGTPHSPKTAFLPEAAPSAGNGDREMIEASGLFDKRYYLECYPDVAKAKLNPLRHFCESGGQELRNPSEAFDSGWYWLWHMLPNGVDGNPLVHYLAAGERAPALPVMVPKKGLSPVDRQALMKQASSLIDAGNLSLLDLRRIGQVAVRLGDQAVAEKALARVAAGQWENPENHMALAAVLVAQKKWWLAVESYCTAIGLDGNHPGWFFKLGQAQEAMKRFEEAAEAYQVAVTASPKKAEWWYSLGYAREHAGQAGPAREAYDNYISLSTDAAVKQFGEGVTHQSRGLWQEAQEAYRRKVQLNPMDAQLRYRLGMTHDRLYQWEEAEKQFRNAIALSMETKQPGWHCRLGFVCERLNKLDDAALAYATAIALSEKHIAYWNYRLGYVFEQAGKYEEACNAYLNAQQLAPAPCAGLEVPEASRLAADASPQTWSPIGLSEIEAHLSGFRVNRTAVLREALAMDMYVDQAHYMLGAAYESMGSWAEAAEAYQAALDRSSEFRSTWFYRLGYVLHRCGRMEDACLAFRQSRQLQRPHGVSEDPLKTNEGLRLNTCYVEYSESLPVRDDVILYESFNGNSLTCNPLALFRKLLEHPRYGSYLHVWVLNDRARIPEQYRHLPNVVFVSKASDGYLRHLATAKYLINNSGFPPYFVRRPEQKYLATWHGTPLKTLGKEQKYKFYDHKRTQRNFLQASHILSPNKHTSDIQLDSYDIRPIFTGLYAETGYPRIDLTLNASEADKARMRARMNLSADRPVVLYAPTWRGTLDNVAFDTSRLEQDLAKLAEQDCQVIFRGHSLLERVLSADDIACQVVPADIDTNELLSIVDVLITDYSSIFFDFLATGRPVLYYIYDEEEYEEERGLYFSMDEMPGIKARTIEELCAGVALAIRGEGVDLEHYRRSQELYNYRDDGGASRRAIEFLFEDSTECALDYNPDPKPSIIINAGSFQANGITTSAINLIKAIDRRAFNVVVCFSPTSMEQSPECLAQFRKLPADIYAIPRYGNMPGTLEERWIRRHQENGTTPLGEEAWSILQHAYGREFQRIFGNRKYDSAVAFSGYDAFWTSVLVANGSQMQKVIYLHNDMYSEHVGKYPELARMFDLYRYADRLVSVSEQTNALNKMNLSGWSDDLSGKFVHCDNVINGREIIEFSGMGLECPEDAALFGGGKTFINIGRLSVEKDQQKLIRAFVSVGHKHPDARLLILGDGPLRATLERLIVDLGLSSRVHLLGYRRNPYSYLKAADCFVLSSNHEGQPMTLLESLVLAKPIIATDIVGNRSVMDGRGGLLVSNDVEGLIGGMIQFLEDKIPLLAFDWQLYNQSAIGQFHQAAFASADSNAGMPENQSHAQPQVNLFTMATSENYLEVQRQLNGLARDALIEKGCSVSETGKACLDGALNFTWFIRQRADVLMSHGVADKNYYWMKDPKNNQRYLDRFKAVCVPGRWMKDRIVSSPKLKFGEDAVFAVGWPRLDLLRELQEKVTVPATSEEIRILWAPTHDNRKRGPEQKSTSTYPDFLPYAEKLSRMYQVESSPHPHNRTDKTPTVEKMLRSNVVVSDFGTMVYEAWALGKPVIFPIWILGDRVQKYLPESAEAFIFENKIGYHPESYEEMLEILKAGPVVTKDVHDFMDEYLDNYRGGRASERLADALITVAKRL